jgi:putative endonuclease
MSPEPECPGAWFVYLARCGDGSIYTGITNDLDARLEAHNRGKGASYTRGRLPVALVYSETAENRSAALRRESEIKRMSRKGKLGMMAPAGGDKGKRD